jgi:hypothetical protein
MSRDVGAGPVAVAPDRCFNDTVVALADTDGRGPPVVVDGKGEADPRHGQASGASSVNSTRYRWGSKLTAAAAASDMCCRATGSASMAS